MKKYLSITALCLLCILMSGCCVMIPGLFPSDVVSTGQTPPPATYAVSSVGTMEGKVQFYSSVTDEILVINEDGTGSFFFDGQSYTITLEGNQLLVDGEECICQYNVLDTGEAILFLYWARDNTNTIALRPITNP